MMHLHVQTQQDFGVLWLDQDKNTVMSVCQLPGTGSEGMCLDFCSPELYFLMGWLNVT